MESKVKGFVNPSVGMSMKRRRRRRRENSLTPRRLIFWRTWEREIFWSSLSE
jgi:hypothetical protein